MRNPNTGKVLALALALAAGLAGAAAAEEATPAYDEALARADAAGQILVLDFYADW
jgi:hypothetical protein